MQIFIFYHKFHAFLHIVAFEEILQIWLKLYEDAFKPHLYLLGFLEVGHLDLFVNLEDLEHKFTIRDIYFLLDVDSP